MFLCRGEDDGIFVVVNYIINKKKKKKKKKKNIIIVYRLFLHVHNNYAFMPFAGKHMHA